MLVPFALASSASCWLLGSGAAGPPAVLVSRAEVRFPAERRSVSGSEETLASEKARTWTHEVTASSKETRHDSGGSLESENTSGGPPVLRPRGAAESAAAAAEEEEEEEGSVGAGAAEAVMMPPSPASRPREPPPLREAPKVALGRGRAAEGHASRGGRRARR